MLLGFMIVGAMLCFTVQALGEMAVLYPVNGAFFAYGCRFIDPAWYRRQPTSAKAPNLLMLVYRGFAMGWDYAIGWLTVLPFEITAAGITISFWHEYNIGIWIATFLSLLVIVQVFGVRGYGEGQLCLLSPVLVDAGSLTPFVQSSLCSLSSRSSRSLASSSWV